MDRRKKGIISKLANLKEEARLASDLIDLLVKDSEKHVEDLLNQTDSATFTKVYPGICQLLDVRCQQILGFNCSVESLVDNITATTFAAEEGKSFLDTSPRPRPTSIPTRTSSREPCSEDVQQALLSPLSLHPSGSVALSNVELQLAAQELQEDVIGLPLDELAEKAPGAGGNGERKGPPAVGINDRILECSVVPLRDASLQSSCVSHESSSLHSTVPIGKGSLPAVEAQDIQTLLDYSSGPTALLSEVCQSIDYFGVAEQKLCQSGTLKSKLISEQTLSWSSNVDIQPPALPVEGVSHPTREAFSTKLVENGKGTSHPIREASSTNLVGSGEGVLQPSREATSTKLVGSGEGVSQPTKETSSTKLVGSGEGVLQPTEETSSTNLVGSGEGVSQPTKESSSTKLVESGEGVLQPTEETSSTNLVGSGEGVSQPTKETSSTNLVGSGEGVSQPTGEATLTKLVGKGTPHSSREATTTKLVLKVDSPALPHTPTPRLQGGDVAQMVYVSGESPWDFCLCFASKSSVISDMIASCHASKQLLPFCSARVGDYVFASSSVGFHRGRVEAIDRNNRQHRGVTILDLDKGLVYAVDMKCVWKPVAEISEWRFEAIPCVLNGLLKDKDSIWRSLCVPLFKSALENCELTVTVQDKKAHADGIQELYFVDIFSLGKDGTGKYNKFDVISQIVVSNLHRLKQRQLSGSLASSSSSDHACTLTATNCSSGSKGSDFKTPNTKFVSKKNSSGIASSSEDDFISFSSSRSTVKSVASNQGNRTVPDDQQIHSLKLKENYNNMFQCDEPCTGILSFVLAPYEFYFQIACKENAIMDQYHEKLNHFYENTSATLTSKSSARHRITHLCACYYEGTEYSGWFRAQVLDWRMNKPDMLMQLVDYGDKFTTTLHKVRLLDPSFMEQPLFAIRCHLACVRPPAPYSAWPVECATLFKLYADVSKFYQIIPSESSAVTPPWCDTHVAPNMNHSTSVAVLIIDLTQKPLVTLNDILAEQCFADFVDSSEKETEQSSVIFEEMDSKTKVEDWMRRTLPSNPPPIGKQQTLATSKSSPIGKQQTMAPSKSSLVDKQQTVTPSNPSPVSKPPIRTVPVIARFSTQEEPPATEQDIDAWNPMRTDYENQDYDDENACIAVSGYDPKDDSRICEFFAKDGKCYKGLKCRKEHTRPDPYGYTTDKELVSVRSFSTLDVPSKGKIPLEVTFVPADKPYFYAIYPSDSQTEETLDLLTENMNKPSNVRKYKRLANGVSAAKGQIVLAQYSSDKQWYRAKVVDTSSDEDTVDVFYVDYGNEDTVSESNIRIIEDKFLHLPFQAIQCYLANVDLKVNKLTAAAIAFNSLVKDKVLCAKVVEWQVALRILYCELSDDVGDDIGIMLIKRGLGSLVSDYLYFPDDPTVPIPG